MRAFIIASRALGRLNRAFACPPSMAVSSAADCRTIVYCYVTRARMRSRGLGDVRRKRRDARSSKKSAEVSDDRWILITHARGAVANTPTVS